MTDEQERSDVHMVTQKFKSMTPDSNLSANDQSDDPTMSAVKNHDLLDSINEKSRTSFVFNENLPGQDLVEKILIVIDTVREPDFTPFETRTGLKFTPLHMIKRVVEIFIRMKCMIKKQHHFALMALQANQVSWLCDFKNFTDNSQSSSQQDKLLNVLSKIKEDPIEDKMDICDLGPCFEMICNKTDMAINASKATHVSRVIFIYGRSHAIPLFKTGNEFYQRLLKNSHFYLDSLYVHEPPGKSNCCERIYEKLSILDVNQTSYVLEVGRCLAALHTNMAKFLAHPLQRARQDDSPYTYYNKEQLQDSQKKS